MLEVVAVTVMLAGGLPPSVERYPLTKDFVAAYRALECQGSTDWIILSDEKVPRRWLVYFYELRRRGLIPQFSEWWCEQQGYEQPQKSERES